MFFKRFPSLLGRPAGVGALSLSAALVGLLSVNAPPPAVASGVQDARIKLVSPPNPHVFPLLLAMAENPDLPIEFMPVRGGADIDTAFLDGAEALLAMTYVGAKKRASGAVPDLTLVTPTTWRGFWTMVEKGAENGVDEFADLKGQTLIVSGPAGSGKGGGGDIIFRAAVKREGLDPDLDFDLVYMPIADAQALLETGAASGVTVPGPASTGLEMASRMGAMSLTKAIDYQSVFDGFDSFPAGQLPLGGLHAVSSVTAAPEERAALEAIIKAYAEAAAKLQANPMRYASTVANAFAKHYAATGAPNPPAPVIAAALIRGDLVYRTDIATNDIEADLIDWHKELLGQAPDQAFYDGGDGLLSPSEGETVERSPRRMKRRAFTRRQR